jgi:DNA polymerase-3 subunit delta
MSVTKPVQVRLLHGEDEFQIAQYLAGIEQELGDPVNVSMNTTRLDGANMNLEQLRAIAYAMPFLTARRLVVVERPLTRLVTKELQAKFISLLEGLPPTTWLVLVEPTKLGENNWLLKWAEGAGSQALVKAFPANKGGAMVNWIVQQTRASGGEMTNDAARELAELMGDDTRSSWHEIQKLLAYVNYARKIDLEDVHAVCVSIDEPSSFDLVNALMTQDRRKATGLLEKLLETQDAMVVIGAIVGQFRRLIMISDLAEMGMRQDEIVKELNVHPFVVTKNLPLARRYPQEKLEQVYHRLLVLDDSIKTGQAPADLALDLLVVDLTGK